MKVLTKTMKSMKHLKQKKKSRTLLDSDRWGEMLAFDNYGARNINLRKAFTKVTKKIPHSQIEINPKTDETFLETFFSTTI